jgi:Flp pilus assembly pilin Flp
MRVRHDSSGHNGIEYGVIVGLISLALLLTMILIGNLTRAI